jgi:hypothetical protein
MWVVRVVLVGIVVLCLAADGSTATVSIHARTGKVVTQPSD